MTFGVLELDRNVNSAYQILGLGLDSHTQE